MNHVIIIDDEVQSRNGIAEIFKNHSPGWEIDGLFEDGSLALDYLQQHPEVNLVVTDIRMPKFDGLELISRIRKKQRNHSYHYHKRILGIFLCQESS